MNRDVRRDLLRRAVETVKREGLAQRLGIWAVVGTTKLLLDHLTGRSPRRATQAATTFIELYERSIAGIALPLPLACRGGCAFCCHSFVSATAPELFLLADDVRRHNGASLDDVIAKIEDAHVATRGFDKVSRSRLRPCVLLVDNLCSAYAGRPLACRAFASFSMEKCEAAFRTGSDDIPMPAQNMPLRAACNQALASALARVDLPSQAYELTAGLLRVLQTPDAERRWLAGEDIFAGVQADEASLAYGNDPRVRLYYGVIASAALGKQPVENPWL